MKKTAFFFFYFYLVSTHASIFYPPVRCQMQTDSASCFVVNDSSKIMRCEFLVVGESYNGKIMTALKEGLVLPFEKEQLNITAENKVKDQMRYANGEAHCRYL